MKLPYLHVDAFADGPFKGNQAAVMALETWLGDDVLQAIGAENNFAETAFYIPDTSGQADYELRWFTPTHEVNMCGHATLASGHAVLSQNDAPRVTFRTRNAGILEVVRAQSGYQLSLPVSRVEPRAMPELLDTLNATGACFECVEGAEETAIILFQNEAEIRELKPDMRALAQIDLMAICTAPGQSADIVSRVFVPAWGVDEDSVTGSAHAVLAPFWADRLGRNEFTAHQASARGGDLTVKLASRDDGDRAWLGGPCVTVVEGSFYLSG